MENAVFKARDESILFTQHLPTAIRVAVARSGIKEETSNEKTPAAGQAGKRAALSMPPLLPPYKAYCEAYNATRDRAYFKRLMKSANQDIALACRISGLSRTQVYNQLKKNHIPRRQYNRQAG
jgi:two-component system NtrC family response regulator